MDGHSANAAEVEPPPRPIGPLVTPAVVRPAPTALPDKYAKMLSMGLAEGAVRQKMTVDGIDQLLLDQYLVQQQ